MKANITKKDYGLIKHAQAKFDDKLLHNWHGVASAIRLQSGRIVDSFVLEAENPSLTICAEPIAIEKTLKTLADDPIETIVAVRKNETTEHKIIPPCGRCREFITDYAPDADVIIFDEQENKVIKVKARELLPFKYKRSME